MIQGYPEGVPQFDLDAMRDQMRDRMATWFLFDTIGRRHRKYTCTHCGYKWEHNAAAFRDIDTPFDTLWDRAQVNDRQLCPKCNYVGYVKNRKTFRPPNVSRAAAVFIPVNENDVWVRCFYFEKDYAKSETHVFAYEDEIYHLQPGKAEMWEKYNGYMLGEHFARRSRIIEPFSYNHGAWCEKYDYTAEWVERGGIKGISDTFLRYSAWERYANRFPYRMPLLKYMCAYARYPQIEVLCKVGVFDAVQELVENGAENKRVMDWNAKTPWEMHRLSKPLYKVWTSGAYHCDLRILKLFRRMHGKCERDFETAKMLLDVTGSLLDAMNMITLGRRASKSPREVARYFERISEDNNGTACRYGYTTAHSIYSAWCDWQSMLKREGADLSKINPFPRDLKAEHDAAVDRAAQRRAEADRKVREQMIAAQEAKYKDITETYNDIREKYAYQNDTYAIVVPQNASAVIAEGLALRHCAGTSDRYFERMRRRETFVLFLRRVSKIKTPWYTLEVEPGGTIRQKRTMHDEQNADLLDAEPFLREWQEVIKKRMTSDDLAAAMAARRMRITEMEELMRTGTTVKFGSLRGKRLYDVLSADLMEQVYDQKTGGGEAAEINEGEVKQA